jgi:hypothetical protein
LFGVEQGWEMNHRTSYQLINSRGITQHDYKASSRDFRWVCIAILVGWKRDFKVR